MGQRYSYKWAIPSTFLCMFCKRYMASLVKLVSNRKAVITIMFWYATHRTKHRPKNIWISAWKNETVMNGHPIRQWCCSWNITAFVIPFWNAQKQLRDLALALVLEVQSAMILQHTASVQVTSLRDNPVLVSTVNLYIWRLCTSSALKKAKLKPPISTVGELKYLCQILNYCTMLDHNITFF